MCLAPQLFVAGGNFLNIFCTALLIGFSTCFASRTRSPVGPFSSVCEAVPRHTPFFVLASEMSITSVPLVTGHDCELAGMPVAMELSDGAQLGFVIVRSLVVAVSVVNNRSGSLSTFCIPLAD